MTYFNFVKTLLLLLTVVCIYKNCFVASQQQIDEGQARLAEELLRRRLDKDTCEVYKNARLIESRDEKNPIRWEPIIGVLGVTIGYDTGPHYANGALNCIEVAKKTKGNSYRTFRSCQHLVIAAHLVDSQDIIYIQVCLNPNQAYGECQKNMRVAVNIEEGIIFHPDYDPDTHLNDIALLELPYNLNKIVKDEDGDENPYFIEPWTRQVFHVGTVNTATLEAITSEPFEQRDSSGKMVPLPPVQMIYRFPKNVQYYYVITWGQAIKSPKLRDKCKQIINAKYNQPLVMIYLPKNLVMPHTDTTNCPFTDWQRINKRQSGSGELNRPDLFLCLNATDVNTTTIYEEFGFLAAHSHGYQEFIVGHYSFYDKKSSKPVIRITQLYQFKPWMDYVGLQVFLPEDQRRKGLRFKKWTKKHKTSTDKLEADLVTERSKPAIYYDDANAYREVVFVRNPCTSSIVSSLSYGHPSGFLSAFAVIAIRSIMF